MFGSIAPSFIIPAILNSDKLLKGDLRGFSRNTVQQGLTDAGVNAGMSAFNVGGVTNGMNPVAKTGSFNPALQSTFNNNLTSNITPVVTNSAYNPALQSSFNNNLGNVAPVAKTGAYNPALKSSFDNNVGSSYIDELDAKYKGGGGYDPNAIPEPTNFDKFKDFLNENKMLLGAGGLLLARGGLGQKQKVVSPLGGTPGGRAPQFVPFRMRG